MSRRDRQTLRRPALASLVARALPCPLASAPALAEADKLQSPYDRLTPNDGSYKVGIFSNDGNKEINAFDAGYFTLLKLGHDWANELRLDKAEVTVNCVYQQEDSNNTPDLSNVLSIYSKWEQGRWGMTTGLRIYW